MELACRACRAALPGDARFCPRCGIPVSASAPSRRPSPSLMAAGAALAVLVGLGLVVWRGGAMPRPPAPGPAPGSESLPAPTAPMPDLSGMAPRERFDRLYARIVQGLRAGDTLALVRFAPMALGAYEMLDSADVDSTVRRQARLLRLHLGDPNAAQPAEGR